MNTSIKLNTPCELVNVTPLNPMISKCQIKVCYVGEEANRNGSIITKETAVKLANSLPGSPIVGFFNETAGDFEEHNKVIEIVGGKLNIKDKTRPYGFVDLNAQVWFQDYLDGDAIHTYLVTEGYIWTGQYPEAKRIIEKGNNQSMDIGNEFLNADWSYDDKSGMEFFIINEAVISNLCILGEDYEPCFEGSQITKFSLLDEDFNTKIYNLMKEVRKMKGGNLTVEDNREEILNPEDEVAIEEPVEEVSEPEVEVEEPAAEPEEEIAEPEAEEAEEPVEEIVEPEPAEPVEENEGEAAQFSLTDLQDLQEKYSALEAQFAELQAKYDTMESEYNTLVAFKQTKDREQKQAMIDSFCMLSDTDKADVQANIDTYSLDDIEAKLSIICVRNKLNLSGHTDSEDTHSSTFSIDEVDDDSEDTNVPALVSALRNARKNNN